MSAPSVDDLSVPLAFTSCRRAGGSSTPTPTARRARRCSRSTRSAARRSRPASPSASSAALDRATLRAGRRGGRARLAQVTDSVEVVDRQEVGSGHAPGITQTLLLVTSFGGVTQELVQSQVHIEVPLRAADPGEVPGGPARHRADRHQRPRPGRGAVLRDFQAFVDSVHVEVRARRTPRPDPVTPSTRSEGADPVTLPPTPDLDALLEQVRVQQEQVAQAQRSVEALEIRGSSRGDEVSVTLRGTGQFTELTVPRRHPAPLRRPRARRHRHRGGQRRADQARRGECGPLRAVRRGRG